jgi:glycosyltransferase involved in cell wall biosynthesis
MRRASRNDRPAVCIVRHNYYPDSHVRRDAEALVQAGHDVSVVSLRRPTQPARETINGVEVYRLPVVHRRGSPLRYAWEYSAFAVLAFIQITLLHLKKRFRVVEVDNMPDILVFSALVPKLTGARVLLYIFDNMPELLAYVKKLSMSHPVVRFLGFLERFAASFADRVVVTQEMPRRMLVGRGVPAEKITVVLNCADDALFKRPTAAQRAREDDVFEIVSHGVILERYGIQTLIDALPRIAAEVPNVRVQIFGEGEYRQELEARARRNGVADRVLFRGFAPLDDLISTLSRAHVGYVGMLNDLVLPNKLMEYLTMGVPVALSRWPTFEYYLPDDAVNYFRAGDADDLARAVIAVQRNPAAAEAQAERAIEVSRSYRWPVQREVYLGVYAGLVGSSHAPNRTVEAPRQGPSPARTA